MVIRNEPFLPALLAFSLLLAPSAAAQSGPMVWVAPSLHRVGLSDSPSTVTQAQISAARGESESFQIIVKAPASGLSNVNLTVSDLQGPSGAVIPQTNFTLYREYYVNVSPASPSWGTNLPLGAGWYPDGLIPFTNPATGLPPVGGALVAVPCSVGANSNQPFWVDLLVPRTAAAGQYTGTYTVTTNQGTSTGQVAVTVWNFTLPLKPSLKSAFLFSQAGSLLAQEELLRHRLSPLTTNTADQLTLMNNYGLGTTDIPFWSGADVSTCSMSPAPSVSQFQASAAAQQSGLSLFDYSADEVGSCSNLVTTIQQWAANMHQAGVNNLITIAPTPSLYNDGTGTGRSAVDIWVMLPVMYDGAQSQVSYVLQKGDSAWSYNTLVQDSYSPKWEIDFDPINFRIQPGFISQSLNLTGLLYWRVDYWPSDPWNNVNTTGLFSTNNYPGDGSLVYPGADVGITGVAPSMRLKWLRDGVDDYEYVQILKSLGQGSQALQIAHSVGPDWTNWTRDPVALESARQQLGQLIDQLSSPAAPAAPSNPSPASGATGVAITPTLTWSASTNATSYDIYFGTSSNPALAGSTTSLSYSPAALSNSTTYSWKVVAKNSSGSTSSATWSFTTAAAAPSPPPAPGAAGNPSPASGATGISVTPALSWSAGSNASSYDIYLGTSSSPVLAGSTTGLSYSPAALSNSTTYFWKVVAKNSGGSTSSATWSFTTAASAPGTPPPPGAAANLTPTNGATGVSLTPTITWAAADNATSYDVYLGTSNPPGLAGSTTGLSYSPSALSSGATYYWKIVAKNSGASTSSATWNFMVGASAPTSTSPPGAAANLMPANGATGVSLTPTLTWAAADNTTSYDVYLGPSNPPTPAGSTTSLSYTPTALSSGATYYWMIVAKNSGGSTRSATWSFTTGASAPTNPHKPGAPANLSPATGATGVSLTPTLTWASADYATSYDVYLGTSNPPGLAGSTTSLSYSASALTSGAVYYWKIVATNNNASTSSATWSFTTAASVASGPSVVSVSPSSGSGSSQQFQFTYSDTAGYSSLAGGSGLFNTSVSGVNGCWFWYDQPSKSIFLASDDISTWSAMALGSGATLQNSQCTINNAAAQGSGNNLFLTVSLTFKPAFTGTKMAYLYTRDQLGVTAGYQQLGTWTAP